LKLLLLFLPPLVTAVTFPTLVCLQRSPHSHLPCCDRLIPVPPKNLPLLPFCHNSAGILVDFRWHHGLSTHPCCSQTYSSPINQSLYSTHTSLVLATSIPFPLLLFHIPDTVTPKPSNPPASGSQVTNEDGISTQGARLVRTEPPNDSNPGHTPSQPSRCSPSIPHAVVQPFFWFFFCFVSS
jgi:hypothetical protein